MTSTSGMELIAKRWNDKTTFSALPTVLLTSQDRLMLNDCLNSEILFRELRRLLLFMKLIIIIIMVIFKCYFSGELIALT